MTNTIENVFSSLKEAQKQIDEWEYAGDQTPYVVMEVGPQSYAVVSEEIKDRMQKIVEKEYQKFYGDIYALIAKKIEQTHQNFLKADITQETFNWKIRQIKNSEATFEQMFHGFVYIEEKDRIFHTRAFTYMKEFLNADTTAETFNYKMKQLHQAMGEIPGSKAFFTTMNSPNQALINRIGSEIIGELEKIRNDYLHQNITKETFNWKQRQIKNGEGAIQELISISKGFVISKPIFTHLKEVSVTSLSSPSSLTMKDKSSKPVSQEEGEEMIQALFGSFDVDYDADDEEEISEEEEARERAQLSKTDKKNKARLRRKSIKIKLTQIIHIILDSCLKRLQGKKKSQAKVDIAVKPVTNGLEMAAVYAGLKDAIEKTPNIHYKEKLVAIIDSVLMVYATEHLFLQLEAEKKFDLTQVYPDLIKSFQKQCVLDYENYQLVNKKDDVLEGALDKFLEKVQHIFEEKFLIDTKQTQVLKQYLSHKK